MRVKYAFFADAARVNQQMTCDMIGAGVDSVCSRKLPVMIPSLAIIARVEFEPEEIGKEFELGIDRILPDGTIDPISINLAKFKVDRHPWYPHLGRYISQITEIRGPEFPTAGIYT